MSIGVDREPSELKVHLDQAGQLSAAIPWVAHIDVHQVGGLRAAGTTELGHVATVVSVGGRGTLTDGFDNAKSVNGALDASLLEHVVEVSLIDPLHQLQAEVVSEEVIGVGLVVGSNTTGKEASHVRRVLGAVVGRLSQAVQLPQESLSVDAIGHAEILLEVLLIQLEEEVTIHTGLGEGGAWEADLLDPGSDLFN